jgi:hypothetical protein
MQVLENCGLRSERREMKPTRRGNEGPIGTGKPCKRSLKGLESSTKLYNAP